MTCTTLCNNIPQQSLSISNNRVKWRNLVHWDNIRKGLYFCYAGLNCLTTLATAELPIREDSSDKNYLYGLWLAFDPGTVLKNHMYIPKITSIYPTPSLPQYIGARRHPPQMILVQKGRIIANYYASTLT